VRYVNERLSNCFATEIRCTAITNSFVEVMFASGGEVMAKVPLIWLGLDRHPTKSPAARNKMSIADGFTGQALQISNNANLAPLHARDNLIRCRMNTNAFVDSWPSCRPIPLESQPTPAAWTNADPSTANPQSYTSHVSYKSYSGSGRRPRRTRGGQTNLESHSRTAIPSPRPGVLARGEAG